MPQNAVTLLPIVLIGAAVTLGSMIVWGVILYRLSTGRPLVPFEPRRAVPWNGLDLAMVLAVLMLLGIAGHRALALYHNGPAPDVMGPAEFAVSMGVELATLAFALALMVLSGGATATDLGIRAPKLGRDLILGGLAYLAAVVPVSAIQLGLQQFLPYKHPLIESYRQHPGPEMLAVSMVLAVVVAPFCEELFFRVLLQGWFETVAARWRQSRLARPDAAVGSVGSEDAGAILPALPQPDDANPYRSPLAASSPPEFPSVQALDVKPAWWPILASSIIFALMHWGQGLAPVPLFFLALVLGYLYQRTHRIWPSLVVHVLLNGGSMLILWLSLRAEPGM